MKIIPNLFASALLAVVPFIQPTAAVGQPKPCPPGLAKKNPPCVPPGLAKQGDSSEQWLNKDQIGNLRNREDLIFLDNYSHYNLPRLPYSQRYAVVDDRIVVIDRESYEVLQLIRAFTALAN